MAMKRLDPEDPMALVGVRLERGPDDKALTEMAWCFVEEFARMGWSGERILRLFHNPFYRGPHQILRMKGEGFVRGLVETIEGMRSESSSSNGR